LLVGRLDRLGWPSASKADDLIALANRSDRDGADRRVQAQHVAAAREDSNNTFLGIDISHDAVPFCTLETQLATRSGDQDSYTIRMLWPCLSGKE
jgi:hypothetical protein